MREKTLERIRKEKIVVIVRGVAPDRWIPLAESLYFGGIRLIEITFSADGSLSDEFTADGIMRLHAHFGDQMSIGAGTVLTRQQVSLVKNAGGEFIISPDVNADVIRATREANLVSMPGAFTPTEITAAARAGADFVKVFPVTALGPEYIKAIKAPLSHIPLLAVGGVNENNLTEYLNAGVCGFGIGGNIVNKSMIEKEDYEGITRLARTYTARVN